MGLDDHVRKSKRNYDQTKEYERQQHELQSQIADEERRLRPQREIRDLQDRVNIINRRAHRIYIGDHSRRSGVIGVLTWIFCGGVRDSYETARVGDFSYYETSTGGHGSLSASSSTDHFSYKGVETDENPFLGSAFYTHIYVRSLDITIPRKLINDLHKVKSLKDEIARLKIHHSL